MKHTCDMMFLLSALSHANYSEKERTGSLFGTLFHVSVLRRGSLPACQYPLCTELNTDTG